MALRGTPRASGLPRALGKRGWEGTSAAVRLAGLGLARTLFGLSCCLFPAPLRKPGASAGVILRKRGVLVVCPFLSTAGSESGRMSEGGDGGNTFIAGSGTLKRTSLFLLSRPLSSSSLIKTRNYRCVGRGGEQAAGVSRLLVQRGVLGGPPRALPRDGELMLWGAM